MKRWKEEFGDLDWADTRVRNTLIKKAILALNDVLNGKRVSESTRKASQFLAGRLAYPETVNMNSVHIHLTGADIESAKRKAGLLYSPGGLQVTDGKEKGP